MCVCPCPCPCKHSLHNAYISQTFSSLQKQKLHSLSLSLSSNSTHLLILLPQPSTPQKTTNNNTSHTHTTENNFTRKITKITQQGIEFSVIITFISFMAMGPERSKPLHNFSLPCLKWGTQRLLRCVNTDPFSLDRRSSKFDPPQMNQNDQGQVSKRKNDESVDAVREKIMGDLRVAAKKLKVSIFEDEGAASNARPWNLRNRRAACKAPLPPCEEERRFFDVGYPSPSPVKEKKKMMMMTNERVKFSVSLCKEEVEQDFWALVGTRPPRRPKKRPRIVQRQLNTLFPGLWLAEVTAESYKVNDVPE